MLEKTQKVLLGGRGVVHPEAHLWRFFSRLVPLIGDDQNGLREVEGRVGGVQGHLQEGVREGHVLVVKPRSLGPEDDAAGLPFIKERAQVLRRAPWSEDGFDHVSQPRGGGVKMADVRDRLAG